MFSANFRYSSSNNNLFSLWHFCLHFHLHVLFFATAANAIVGVAWITDWPWTLLADDDDVTTAPTIAATAAVAAFVATMLAAVELAALTPLPTVAFKLLGVGACCCTTAGCDAAMAANVVAALRAAALLLLLTLFDDADVGCVVESALLLSVERPAASACCCW